MAVSVKMGKVANDEWGIVDFFVLASFSEVLDTPILYQSDYIFLENLSFWISNLISAVGKKEMNIADNGIGGLFQPVLRMQEQ